MHVLFTLKKGLSTKKLGMLAKKRIGVFCNYNTFKEKSYEEYILCVHAFLHDNYYWAAGFFLGN